MPVLTEVTKYRVLFGDSTERVLSMPSKWKITFGPNVPGATRRMQFGGGGERGWCFRVYSNTRPQQLKMVLPNVVEFYEEDSFHMEEITRDRESQLVLSRERIPRTPPNVRYAQTSLTGGLEPPENHF